MRIQVNPDQLRQVAQQLRRANSDLRGASGNIGRIVGGMSLEIRVRTNVDERAAAARRQAEALAERVNSLARYLEERAEIFQKADGQGVAVSAVGGVFAGLLGGIGALLGRNLGSVFSTILSTMGGLLAPAPVNGMAQLLTGTSSGSVLGASIEAKDYDSMRWGQRLAELKRLEQEIATLQRRIPEGMTLENVRTKIADLDKQIAALEGERDEAEKQAEKWWNQIIPTWPPSLDGDGVLWRVRTDDYENQVAEYERQLRVYQRQREQLLQNQADLQNLELLKQNKASLSAIIDGLSQYDGITPANGTIEKPWVYLNPPVTSVLRERDPKLYDAVLNQFAVENNTRYSSNQQGKGDTYCNIFVWDATRAMGAEIPHWVDGNGNPVPRGEGSELGANGSIAWLEEHGPKQGWYIVDAKQAQEQASNGQPVVATYKNPGKIGHVAMVRPGEYSTTEGPRIAQAGGRNFNNGSVKDGFGGREVVYYAHE
ncbi:MAG: hypothetical protein JW892_10155 [Anaerolineae bacterium]|nr:hypothetical protein [Anaerolineae bacterium]